MCTFQHTHAPWFSSNEPPRSIWSLLFKSPGLHNTPRIKVFQFSQKTLPKTLALAQTKRLNQHYKFLAEFQNTWQTKFKSRNITTPTISFLPLCPMSSNIKILFWNLPRETPGISEVFKMYSPSLYKGNKKLQRTNCSREPRKPRCIYLNSEHLHKGGISVGDYTEARSRFLWSVNNRWLFQAY